MRFRKLQSLGQKAELNFYDKEMTINLKTFTLSPFIENLSSPGLKVPIYFS